MKRSGIGAPPRSPFTNAIARPQGSDSHQQFPATRLEVHALERQEAVLAGAEALFDPSRPRREG